MFSEDIGLTRDDVLRRGERIADQIATARPDLVEEIGGIAAGARQPTELVAALNARTELLAGGRVATGGDGECSVAGIASRGGDGRHLLAQTWDFHPDLAASRLVWSVEQADGSWFATFTEAGLLAKTGLNDSGLGVTLNFLASEADGGTEGFPVHVLLRMILDGCRDADTAERLLHDSRVSASACITVGAAEGKLTAYEVSPVGSRALGADGRGWLAHTNHFVERQPARDLIAVGTGGAGSVTRLEHLHETLPTLEPDAEPPALGTLLSTRDADDEAGCVFRLGPEQGPWLDRCATLATVVYDLDGRRMWIRVEPDPEAPLHEVSLPAARSV